MVILFIVLIIVIVSGFSFIFFYFKKQFPEKNENLTALHEQMKEIKEKVDYRMADTLKIISDITEKITRLDETNKRVVNFAEQLQNLQNILSNPKQRGVVGEYFLETILSNVLPPGSYQMQYRFSNGEIVDAVIFVRNKIVPIDSKFSLENYERLIKSSSSQERKILEEQLKKDLKNRIEETAKYIRPSEKTMNFSFMFIPSETLYYDLLSNKVGKLEDENLISYAARVKKVIIVSPTSFFAYLQTVLQGLKALEIEKSALEIKKKIEKLSSHLLNFDSYLTKLGDHLKTTNNFYEKAESEFKKIDKDIYKITGSRFLPTNKSEDK